MTKEIKDQLLRIKFLREQCEELNLGNNLHNLPQHVHLGLLQQLTAERVKLSIMIENFSEEIIEKSLIS